MKNTFRHLIVSALFFTGLAAASQAQTVSLDFNNNTLNEVSGTPQTLNQTAGTSFTLALYVSVTSQPVDSLDYWLSQFSGPTAGAFSITGVDYTGSLFGSSPPSSAAQITDPTDNRSNSSLAITPDTIPDNQLNPRNAYNLGSVTPGSSVGPTGNFLVATYTISIANNASGLYQLQTYDYPPRGWSNSGPPALADQPFTSQAAININVAAVPEPSTWSLVGLGGLGFVGVTMMRRRRLS